jgi:hypothetical protein
VDTKIRVKFRVRSVVDVKGDLFRLLERKSNLETKGTLAYVLIQTNDSLTPFRTRTKEYI